jgi:sortase A
VRRWLLLTAAAIAAVDIAYVAGGDPSPAAPVATVADLPVLDATTTSTTTTTTITSTTLPPVAPSSTAGPPAASRPVRAPVNPYQPEAYRVIGSIEIPKLGLRAPIGEGISLSTIDRGPAHWPGTAMPGQVGNVVIAGHRVTHTHPFRYLDRLVPGDEIVFDVAGRRWTYRMTGTEVVTPDQTRIVRQTSNPTATLFACHPPGSARYRYVVYFELVA